MIVPHSHPSGSDIIMQLDDVVSSTVTGPRVEEAMYRCVYVRAGACACALALSPYHFTSSKLLNGPFADQSAGWTVALQPIGSRTSKISLPSSRVG